MSTASIQNFVKSTFSNSTETGLKTETSSCSIASHETAEAKKSVPIQNRSQALLQTLKPFWNFASQFFNQAPGLKEVMQGTALLKKSDIFSNENKVLQNLLKAKGYPVDDKQGKHAGFFGPKTEAAVIAFQKAKGLQVDGIVGKQTMKALLEVGVEKPHQEAEKMAAASETLPTAASSSEGTVPPLVFGKKVSPEFRKKVFEISQRLKIDPNHLMAVMAFETGETFGAGIKNRMGSGATGLIQFVPKTAQNLGTSTEALSKMTPLEQLDYVEKYLKPNTGKMSKIEDLYMAVLWPVAVGKPNSTEICTGKSYGQNASLDEDGNRHITKEEARLKVSMILERGKKWIE